MTPEEKIEALEGIGYVSGSMPAGDHSGVTVYARERAHPGLNLYVSGHAPEARLIDMEGKVLHRWHYPYALAVPDTSVSEMERELYRDFWRRVHLSDNGDLLAIFEGHALIALNSLSELRWVFRGKPHHDLFVTEEGHIFVLTRKASVLPRIDPVEPFLEDFVSELDADGNELRRVSILAAFENSPFSSHLEQMNRRGDLLHTNTLELVDERLAARLPGVRPGQVLISCLFLDTIAVLDLEEQRIVWALSGSWRWQHQPTVLENGDILLFDNLGGAERAGKSRVIELAPESGELRWVYAGRPSDPLESNTCGSCQRLPNGNTLITESDYGRALEVDPEGKTVWEFHNPHRAGPDGRLVATLFELIRLPLDQPIAWVTAHD